MLYKRWRFYVFMCTGENDSNKLRVDGYFFVKRRKTNLRFQKCPDTRGQDLRQLVSRNSTNW